MQAIISYYYVIFLISVALSCIYLYMYHKHFNVNFSLIFTIIPIVNLGYVFQAQTKTVAEAILAIKIIYLGGCLLILFITFYIFGMCQLTIPKWFKMAMVMASASVYMAVLTIGHNGLFYQSISLSFENGFVVFHKTYGPFHTVFYVMELLYLFMGIAAILYSYNVKTQVSRRIIWLLFIPELLTLICYFGEKFITNTFELVPVAYVAAQIVYLIIAHYACIYDIEDTAVDSLAENGSTGFIAFTFDLTYLGSNRAARAVFQPLLDLNVDKSLSENEELSDLFIPWINTFNEDPSNDKFYYKSRRYIYLIDINYLYHNADKIGYQFVITDDTKNQEYIELLDHYNQRLEQEVRIKTADIVKMHNNLIRSMAKMVESRDNSTGGHIVRTSDVVEILMEEIMKDQSFTEEHHITEVFRRNIIKAAPLHDIGKIAVDDAILKKPGRFTDEEFEKMKTHAPEGAKVLHSILRETEDTGFKVLAENVAHYHHERMDGSGYPEGLSGNDIPMEARIMAIADVYDALVSKRVYKERMSFEEADRIMMESMGKHFDPQLKKFYVAARSGIEAYYRNAEPD